MPDSELSEDVRAVTFDRAVGDEQRGGARLARPAFRSERRDPLLGRRQGAGRGRAATDALQLTAHPLGPERSTYPLEDPERLGERLARLASALQPALGDAEGEQRASVIEWELDLLVEGERFLVRLERIVAITSLSGEHPAAACTVRERRDTLQPPCVPLVPVEELDRLLVPAQLDQRFHLVDDEADRARLTDRLLSNERDDRVEPRPGRTHRAERQLQMAERLRCHELGTTRPALGAEFERPRRRRSSPFRAATNSVHEALQRQVVDDDVALSGLLGRFPSLESTPQRALELAQLTLDVAERNEEERG